MKNYLLYLFCLFSSIALYAQDAPESDIEGEIDPSKPTNLYTQVNTAFEYQSGKNQDLYGLRTNIQYAFDANNLVLAEVPLLYNDRTSKFGLADMRIRYFNAVKRNITERFIAIVPFADVSFPTGSFENGLGSSSWSLAGGVIFGFVASEKLSLFPGISYVHLTKPTTDLIPEAVKFSSNGIGLQFNASYVFSKSLYMFINPTPTFLNTDGDWKTIWSGETNLNKIIIPNKFKMNVGWLPNFTNEVHVFRLGATFYL
ncbi:hypothetical protein POV26_09020 [Aequorivita todarodis]|uniref:hypothetical protein n=1 Tax=Aequorivita todarodis TaxID=2036821 RepID=UPI00235079A3|nr:hypothetical protein [Aequorivita todarodis]MDC8001178.1 hypothetical protein [Aequorivita todarodis]